MLDQLYGLELHSHPLIPETQPRIQLSPRVCVSETFRAECNAKYREWFGEERVFWRVGNTIFAHPTNIEALKREVAISVSSRSGFTWPRANPHQELGRAYRPWCITGEVTVLGIFRKEQA